MGGMGTAPEREGMSAIPDYDDRFRDLYLNNGEDLRAYCRRRLGREDADDALVEVFAVAWRRFDKIPEGQEARLWLYGVARNVVRNGTRTTRRTARLSSRLTASSEAPRSGPAESLVTRSEHEDVKAALTTLSPAIRNFFGSMRGRSSPGMKSPKSSASPSLLSTCAFIAPSPG